MNFFQRHMTLKGQIVLFLGAFFTALLFCQNAADILPYAGMLALTGLLCLRDKH
ncbi:hypothetical protein [Gemmiger sp.]|uniref:hypothetical protein n=1 Tax=Gemmiger sp. TaxID=2049027 RepID=UPI00307F7329